jgi:hypothetical protein
MRVTENRVPKRIFPQKKKKATEQWRELDVEGSQNISVLRKSLGLLMKNQRGRETTQV